MNKSLIFCTAILIFLDHLHHAQTEDTNYRNLFLQLCHVSSEHELSFLHDCTLAIFGPFVQMLSKRLSSVLLI
jgi:hypothetical protein